MNTPSDAARLSPSERLTRFRQVHAIPERYPAVILTPAELAQLGNIVDPVQRLTKARQVLSQRQDEPSVAHGKQCLRLGAADPGT